MRREPLYHWSKNEHHHQPKAFLYKGLVFPLYAGKDAEIKSQQNGNKTIFAFFGKRAMTESQIRYHVGLMIESGEYRPPAAMAAA